MKTNTCSQVIWAILLVFLATPLPAAQSMPKETRENETAIRQAYQKRQKELVRAAQHREEDQRERGMKGSSAWAMPLAMKVVCWGVGLIVIGSISDRRGWLTALLGKKTCRRLGYSAPLDDARHWPTINPVCKYPTPIPTRLTEWHSAFEEEDDDRIILDMDEVLKYADERDLGFDPRVGQTLATNQNACAA